MSIKITAKNLKSKTAITMVLILMLAGTALATFVPTASAKDVDTYSFVSVAPNPVGIGQTAYVIFWLHIPPPTAEGVFGDRWEGLTITVTPPDGHSETLGPFKSDAVGSQVAVYTPTQVGTYTFQMNYAGQTLAGANRIPNSVQGAEYIGDYFKPSTSNIVSLTVQQTAVEARPDVPVPTDYWQRPIYGENHNWYAIGSNWLMNGYDYNGRFFDVGSAFNPYTRAPNAPHILWSRAIDDGGIVGGAGALDQSAQEVGYYMGMSYEAKFTPPLVINGRLYYNIYPSGAKPGYVVVDLYTGEELWRKTDQTLTLGQIYDYESFNQHGSQSYLWSLSGTTWSMSDAFTGDVLVQVANATGGGMPVMTDKGDLLLYYLSGTANTLTLWNSSKCIPPAGPTGSSAFQWRPERFPMVDWKNGIEWNVSVPDVPGSQGIRTATKTFDTNTLVAASLVPATATEYAYIVEVGYDAKTGAQLWVENRAARQQTPQPIWMLLDYSNLENGIYTYRARDQMVTYAYDARTGRQLWVSEPSTDAWAMFPSAGWNAYGMNYFASYAGKITAYDLQTGAFKWEYFGGSSGFDTPYGIRPFYSGVLIADGKIFATNSEHSPSQPLFRGQEMHVVNAYNGEKVWSLSGWWTSHQTIAVDGYVISHNGYDNKIYCIGKGPSATTVTATPKVTSTVDSILIEGTVTDQSPGAKGTPAIGDAYMGPWMEFLYMQQPCPANLNGVPVKLVAIDANGNSQNIGTVTSDGNGVFKKLWMPSAAGEYTIVATFAGSESYGSSQAATAVGVYSTVMTPESESATDNTLSIIIVVGVVIAILIGLVNMMALRKR